MIDLEKLKTELSVQGAARAEKMLDDMIAVHKTQRDNFKEKYKRQLLDVATNPNASTGYDSNGENAKQIVHHTVAVEVLEQLKKDMTTSERKARP